MKNVLKDKNLYLPAALVIGCVVIAVSFYLVQVDKRQSIERQQEIENTRAIYEKEQSELLAKQKECESLSSGVMRKWNNVMGVTYDKDFWEECVVTFTNTETGEVETSPLRFMKDTRY